MVNSSGSGSSGKGTGIEGSSASAGGGGSSGSDGVGGGSSGSGSGMPPSSSASTTLLRFGCGPTGPLTLDVTTTTGRNFNVVVDSEQTVEHLKKHIAKKLKVSKDRICLLHRDRELQEGTLRENGLINRSKLILTPNVETGLLAQRAENTVMQALESLNDNQVNDFLSGKSPLNLSVRLGDHMMLIQLQLSTLTPSPAQAAAAAAAGLANSSLFRQATAMASQHLSSPNHSLHHSHHHHHHHQQQQATAGGGGSGALSGQGNTTTSNPPAAIGSHSVLTRHKAALQQQQQQQQPSNGSQPAPSMAVRRPAGPDTAADGDVGEPPCPKRPTKPIEGPQSTATATSNAAAAAAAAAAARSSSNDRSNVHTNSHLAQNNNDHSIRDNNSKSRNCSSSSNIIGKTRRINHSSGSSFLGDQQQAADEARAFRVEIRHQQQEEGSTAQPKRPAKEEAAAASAAGKGYVDTAGDKQRKPEATGTAEAVDFSIGSSKTIAPGSAVPSPIKSLSKLVSARMITTSDDEEGDGSGGGNVDADGIRKGASAEPCGEEAKEGAGRSERDAIPACSDPITANLTSCLCRRLDGGGGSEQAAAAAAAAAAADAARYGKPDAPSGKAGSSDAADATSLLHRTAQNPIARHKAKLQSLARKIPASALLAPSFAGGEAAPTDGQSAGTTGAAAASAAVGQRPPMLYPTLGARTHQQKQQQQSPTAINGRRVLTAATADGARAGCTSLTAGGSAPSNPALAEASRNLTQTLRKLSKRVFTSKPMQAAPSSAGAAASSSLASSPSTAGGTMSSSLASTVAGSSPTSASAAASHGSSSSPALASSAAGTIPPSPAAGSSTPSASTSAPTMSPFLSSGGRSITSGAVIESMKHHGRGIYSGTFSGTLNPALQDRFGRPKRDISTIIHILNDLLSAAPQCAVRGTTSAVHAAHASTNGSFSGTKIHFEPTAASASTAAASAAASSSGLAVAGSNQHSNGTGGGLMMASTASSGSSSSQQQQQQQRHHRAGSESATSWFVPAPASSSSSSSTRQLSAVASKNFSVSSAVRKCTTSVVAGGDGELASCCATPLETTGDVCGDCQQLPGGATKAARRTMLLSKVSDGSSAGASPAGNGTTTANPMPCDCANGLILCVGKTEMRRQRCKYCTARAHEMENSKTKLKLDSLRLIMKQKRERREARKLQSAPYQSPAGAGVASRVATAAAAGAAVAAGPVQPSNPMQSNLKANRAGGTAKDNTKAAVAAVGRSNSEALAKSNACLVHPHVAAAASQQAKDHPVTTGASPPMVLESGEQQQSTPMAPAFEEPSVPQQHGQEDEQQQQQQQQPEPPNLAVQRTTTNVDATADGESSRPVDTEEPVSNDSTLAPTASSGAGSSTAAAASAGPSAASASADATTSNNATAAHLVEEVDWVA